MDSKDSTWFVQTYCPMDVKVNHNIRTIDMMSQQYQIAGGGTTVSMTLAQTALENLILQAKLGNEEIARARDRADYPNVQAAYDAYITLLALSKKYDN